jgi:branched-chain amino acid transport system substrate-binding protein
MAMRICSGRRTRGQWSGLILASCVVLALTGCGDPPRVAIGIALGTKEAEGAMLAYEDAMSAGLNVGIDTVFARADNTKAAPAIQAAELLLVVPGLVAVVGNGNSAASLATSPLYNSHKVIQLSPHATAVLFSSAGPFSYRMVSPDDRQGRFLGERLMAEARGRRVALLYVNDDYGRNLRGEMLRAIEPGAIQWAVDAPYIEGADSATLARRVTSLVETRADLILWIGRDPELDRALPGIRKALGAIPILGSDGVGHAPQLDNRDDRWSGVRFVELVDLDAGPAIRAFRARFQARWGRDPSGSEVLAYDAMSILIAAVADGARSGTEVQRYLDGLGRRLPAFPGIAGPVAFDSLGDVDRSYVISTIQPL